MAKSIDPRDYTCVYCGKNPTPHSEVPEFLYCKPCGEFDGIVLNHEADKYLGKAVDNERLKTSHKTYAAY